MSNVIKYKYLSTSTNTFNFAKYKYSSKDIDKYKYKYFVKNSSTSTKYFEHFSQVKSSTWNAIFMFIMVKVKAMKTQKQQYYAYACMSAVPGIYEENSKKTIYFINNNIHFK